jgi:hypothetical protein
MGAQRKPTYLDESVERMSDADNRRRDPATAWQADGYTPEELVKFQKLQTVTEALSAGFAAINQTYVSL